VNDILALGIIAAAFFFSKKRSATQQGYSDTVGTSEAGSGAMTTVTGSPYITSIPGAVVVPTGQAAVTAINNALNATAALKRSGGTSSPSSIHAQLAASQARLPYGGVSGGVVYAVSAPRAPSAKQAAAIKAAGY